MILPGERILLSSGYGHGAAVIEVTHDAGRFGTRLVWEHTRLKNRFSSSVVHDGFIYGLDETILTCIDAATGEAGNQAREERGLSGPAPAGEADELHRTILS